MSQQATIQGAEMVIHRKFKAPVERLYNAWADPAKMVEWFAPNERWLKPKLEIETVVGGKHNITMRHSDGSDVNFFGKYVEIVPNKRIAFTWIFQEDPEGPVESLVTIDFAPSGEGSELTLTHSKLRDQKTSADVNEGWTGILEMLDRDLSGGVQLQD